MTPTTEQWKMLIRWFLTWGGGIVIGYITARGWLTPDQLLQVSSFFSSETLVALVLSAGGLVLGWFKTSSKGIVQSAARLDATNVKPNGDIEVLDPDLAKAARAAATPPK